MRALPQVFNVVNSSKQLPPDFYRSKAMPMGLLMALTLYLNNTSYLFLTVRSSSRRQCCAICDCLSLCPATLVPSRLHSR